jgi:transcription elongation factor Elf1
MLPVVETPEGREVVARWTCPACGHPQEDWIHPEQGPFLSVTCGRCGRSFSDEQLSDDDAVLLEKARRQAEGMREE